MELLSPPRLYGPPLRGSQVLLGRLNKPVRRRWFALLALGAFAAHAAVPMGFMIGVTRGHAHLELCPAVAPVHPLSAVHPPGMSHHGAMHAAAAGSSCAFALAGAAAMVSPAPILAEPYYLYLHAAHPALILSWPAEPPPRHLAPRGPPTLA